MPLWALLLMLISPGAGAGDWDNPACTKDADWDNPACTKDVVSVPRGAPTEMTCNISNLFRRVSVCLQAPGQRDCQPVFAQAAPGCSSRGGWWLCVQGRSAKMATEEARASHAGQYRWTLVGCQMEQEFTTLNVSGTLDPRPAQDRPPGRLHVAVILVPTLLCSLALRGLQLWCRSLGRSGPIQLPSSEQAQPAPGTHRPRRGCPEGTQRSPESRPFPRGLSVGC